MAAAAGGAAGAVASAAAAARSAAAAPRGAGEMLSKVDADRIEAAVDKAEAGSRGEIVCVLAGEVSHYREIPLAWGAAAALAIPPLAVLAGLHPLALASTGGAWTVAHTAA